MKLSKAAILALKGTDQEAKKRIAGKLNVQPSTIYRWIKENHENLTMAAALDVIAEETGLTIGQILEAEIGEVTIAGK
jgi:hypothetical protein